MYKLFLKIKKIICLFAVMSCSTISFSQTKTINYLTSSLDTSCNVFGPASVQVDSVVHESWAGGVTFNKTNGIQLATSENGSTPSGTAYVIDYNFTPGNNYTISFTAKGDNNYVSLNSSVVFSLNNFPTSALNSCQEDPDVPLYTAIAPSPFSKLTSGSSATYTTPQFNIPGNYVYPYLIIWATGGNPNLSFDILSISKIVITQTPIPPTTSFTLSPSSVNKVCGTALTQTFTVNNVNHTPGVTSYSWNLGSCC